MRFPDGWERPQSGFYEAAEDVVFLEGMLAINDGIYAAGDWAHLPAGFLRRASSALPSALAVARFSGPARWVVSAEGTSGEPDARRTLAGTDEPFVSPLGTGTAVLLRRGNPDSSWYLPGPLDAGSPSAVDAEVLDLDARAWAWVPAGEPLPGFLGPCFCRTFVGTGGTT